MKITYTYIYTLPRSFMPKYNILNTSITITTTYMSMQNFPFDCLTKLPGSGICFNVQTYTLKKEACFYFNYPDTMVNATITMLLLPGLLFDSHFDPRLLKL